MLVASRSARSLDRWLCRIAASLAVAAQLVLCLSGLVEGKAGIGAASHVESAGTSAHYAHNEATCAACAARSLHGTAAPAASPPAPAGPEPSVNDSGPRTTPSFELAFSHPSRAPPAVI